MSTSRGALRARWFTTGSALALVAGLAAAAAPARAAPERPPAAAAQATAPLALDASTPPSVKKRATSLTTASFTPPAGAVLVVAAQTNGYGSGDVKSFAVTDSLKTHLAYHLVQTRGNATNDVYSSLYWAAVAGTGPMTVTANIGGTNDYSMLTVLVLTGASTTAPIGASGGGRGATGVISDTYTSTVAGSWGWLVYGDWRQRGVPAVPVGESVYDSYDAKGEDTYALIRQAAPTATAGTAVTMSTRSPTSGTQTTHIYFEVVPAAPPPASPPIVSSFAASPSTITAGQSATLTWSVTGAPAPTLTVDNGVGDVTGRTSAAVSPAQTTTYTLTAVNTAGSASASTTVTVRADTQPPSTPTGLGATAVSSTQVNLYWTASTDDVGVSGYRVLRGGFQVGTSTSTGFADTGLAPGTAYTYTVVAYDGAGNVSAPSQPATTATLPAAGGPEPAGWTAGDPHVHRSCNTPPETESAMLQKMAPQNLRFMSLLADMGNGEVQDPATDLPKVNGQDDPISTADHVLHWDGEWHWDATYTQYQHQALGGHIVALGLSAAQQLWSEYTGPIFDWVHQHGGIAGFAHMQFAPEGIPQTLDCCDALEYPVEVALGSVDFLSEDIDTSGDTAIEAYYRLLNDGFRPGLAAGSDYPCGPAPGTLLTYGRTGAGTPTYRGWIDAIAGGRTVISRDGHDEFLNLAVNGTAGPGDEVDLASAGSVPVSVTWTADKNLSGSIELVQNGVVVATRQASVTATSPATLTATVDFTKSGWLAARRMSSSGHVVHTAAVFVIVGGKPVRVSAADAQFYVDWIDNLLAKTSPGGDWNHFFPTQLAAAQDRYRQARALYVQIAQEASGPAAPVVSSFTASPAAVVPGQSATLTWSVSGNPTPTVTIDHGVGDVTALTSVTVSPGQTTTYTLTAQNSQGTATASTTVTVSATAPETIFTTQAPAGYYSDWPGVDYELGTRFTSDTAGQLTAVRFYKAPGETGTHTGRIWDAAGHQLATVVFTGETASGWQQQALPTPVPVTAGTEYMVTVNTGGTWYAATDYGLSAQVVSGHLRTVVGDNGRYGPVSAYPTSSWEATSYFRDVVFAPQ